MMSELKFKDSNKKIGINDTEILKVIIGKLFVHQKVLMKFLWSLLICETVWIVGFNNFFSVV